jgi:hypothetical protein
MSSKLPQTPSVHLGSGARLGSVPRCSICGESPTHTIGDCPACQSGEVTRMHLLTCRKLLRECQGALDEQYLSAVCSDLPERIAAELSLPNVKVRDGADGSRTKL